MYSSNNNILQSGYPLQRQEQYRQEGIQQQQQPQQQHIMHGAPQYQQHYDGYPASQTGIQAQFFANHQQQINPKQIKFQILFICLEARKWQLQQMSHNWQLATLSELEQQKLLYGTSDTETFTYLSNEMDQAMYDDNDKIHQAVDDTISHLMNGLSIDKDNSIQQEDFAIKVAFMSLTKMMKSKRDRILSSIEKKQDEEQKTLTAKNDTKEEYIRLTAEAKAKEERYKLAVKSKEEAEQEFHQRQLQALAHQQQMAHQQTVSSDQRQLRHGLHPRKKKKKAHNISNDSTSWLCQKCEQSDVDQLGSHVVSYVHPNEEQEECEDEEEEYEDEEDEDDGSPYEQITREESKTLKKISNWIGNAAAITQVLDSLVLDADKKKLQYEGYEKSKTMTPILETSAGAEEIGELVASSIDEEKLSPAEIGKKAKQRFMGMEKDSDVFKTCLLDSTQTTTSATSTSKAPIVFGTGRGSRYTNNTGSTQCRNTLESGLVFVRAGMLPKNTRLCTDYFFAYECNKDEIHHAPALWNLIWSVLHVDQDVPIILAMNELKRFGRGQLLNKLLLIIHEIHPDFKVLPVREVGMHPNEVTNNNLENIFGYNIISETFGSNRGQNNGVPISDEEQERLERISSRARVIASDYLEIAKKGLILKNILDGLERGRETSDEDKSNRKNLKLVVNNVSRQVQDEHAPLNEQPNGIDIELAIKNELDQHMPIQHNNNLVKAVLIYLRRTKGCSKSVWGVSLWQLALAIAAGLEDGCITKDTELIIISEDDVPRTNELNPGLSRAMSRIRAGGVSVFIEASTIRGTSRRVVHNTLEVICEEAVTNTKVILAAQSSDSKAIRMMHAEKEQKRQLALANRNDNFHETEMIFGVNSRLLYIV